MSCVRGNAMIANISFALDGDTAYSTSTHFVGHTSRQAIRCVRYFCFISAKSSRSNTFHPISAHGSYLATAIDVLSNLGIATNGDSTVTTHQG